MEPFTPLNPEGVKFMLEEHARRLNKLENLEAATKLALIQHDFAEMAKDIRSMKSDVQSLMAEKERDAGKFIAGKAIYAYALGLILAIPTVIISIVTLVHTL